MNDIIFLNGMRFYGYHGALPAENEIGQIFIVDITLKVDLHDAGQSDDVRDTVHYGEVFEDVKEIVDGAPPNFLEHLPERWGRYRNSEGASLNG